MSKAMSKNVGAGGRFNIFLDSGKKGYKHLTYISSTAPLRRLEGSTLSQPPTSDFEKTNIFK